ncbi:MAG: SMC family ATPase [Candidatus Brocadiae bacterium]|nr:SMC family ATPase [Candidatus Brocadiia bacterium]
MKYKRLEISDLQDKVFIGIFGENESGKSTIGDVVSFALFGCGVRFPKDNLSQLIQWDAANCEVKVSFSITEGEYTVVRYLDQSNEHRAALYKGSQSTPIAKGANVVTKEIENLTKLNFENFRYSFYLAQKEINILKENKVSTREILHKMLGFDCMEKSCEYLKQEILSLQERLKKIEIEIETTRALIKNIKSDSNLERMLFKQLEEIKKSKNQAQEDFDKNEKELSKYQEMSESHCKMSSCFTTLEISIYYQFYKEKLQQTTDDLSFIYAFLREAHKNFEKKQKDKKEDLLKNQEQQEEIEKWNKEVCNLQLLLDEYDKKIQKQLGYSGKDQNETCKTSLTLAVQKKQKQMLWLNRIKNFTFFSIFLLLLCHLWVWAGVLSGEKKQGFAFLSYSQDMAIFFLVISGVLFAFFSLLVWRIQKKYKQSQLLLHNLVCEIDFLKKEAQICSSFNKNDLKSFSSLDHIQDQSIHKKHLDIQERFQYIFQRYSNIEETRERLEKEEKKNIEVQQEIDQKILKIENFLKNLQSLAKGIDLSFMPQEPSQYSLEKMEEIEKKIYDLLTALQDYRTGLQTYEIQSPIEISKAWQEYEQNRLRFRELSGMVSLGGGTGMFNRLKGALRQKTFDKLFQSIQQEKENFFATIPTLHSLQEKVNDFQRARWIYQEKLSECLPTLKELEIKSQKCQEELIYKKEITTKIQSLLRQAQEIENTKIVYSLSLQMMQESLDSADKKFGPALSRAISKVLPSFTKGRYQKVKVLDDLSIKVLSPEKNDFVDIHELSGGAMDQLFLALRLAFAQAIMSIKASKDWKQFLFFDEPILSFDEKRSDSFLDFLSEYSKSFLQIFMISPRCFPKESFNLVIHTSLDSNILILSGKNTQKINKEYLQLPPKKT